MRFKIIGNHSVGGVEPGKTVDLDDNPKTQALVKAGHLAPVKVESPKKPDPAKGDA